MISVDCGLDRNCNIVMSEADEEVFYECVVCFGARKRGRNGENGTRCKHDSCKKELTRRNKAKQAAALEPAGDAVVDSDPTSCFKVKEVLGMSMCLKMTTTEKRLGCDYGDEDCYYHIRGKFGGSSSEDPDDMISDTRWVQLKELVMNMNETQLSELDKWAAQLQKTAQAARKRIRSLIEAEE